MAGPGKTRMDDLGWLDKALVSARPRAVAALLRYFRDLDQAEEAFQEACLRALKSWPDKGPPRDTVAWLVFAGRNSGIDRIRKKKREIELPPEDQLSELDDSEAPLAEQIDNADYRDDILRLLFVCCHPDLPATQQVALALRIVSGLTVAEIARAFLVSEAAMEQRITRAKRRVANAGIPFDTPTPEERQARIGTVATMVYLVFNEGYSASGGDAHLRLPLCEEAIRLGRLLCGLFPEEPELLGLSALMLLQHARAEARLDEHGEIVLLDDQDRTSWDRGAIEEGMALLERAERRRMPGPFQLQAAIASVHARAATPADTDWRAIDLYYRALEAIQPSPVVTLNRAVARWKLAGPAEALALIEPLGERLDGYFHFHGVRGTFLNELGRREEAVEAFKRAIAVARTAQEAAHIRQHLDRLQGVEASGPRGQGSSAG